MTDMNEAGTAGGEPTPIATHTHVAGGDGPLSARDAARSLLDFRRKSAAAERGETPPAEVASATQATAQPGTESAVEAGADPATEQAPGETESQADPAEALPPIEPPRSWTKEEKERFASLPRETQEYLASRETERDRDFRQRQNEAAEHRKAIDAEREKVEQARGQYEQSLQLVLGQLQDAFAGEFADIKSWADIQALAVNDPLRYSKWDANQKRIAAMHQEVTAAQQRAATEAQQKLETFKQREAEKLAEKVPEIADKVQREKLFTAGRDLMRDVGFTDQEIGQLANGEAAISIHDHRLHLLIRDGVRYREAQAQLKTKVEQKKPVPPVQRPGAAPEKGAQQAAELKTLQTNLSKLTGIAAIRAAARLTAAQRRAG